MYPTTLKLAGLPAAIAALCVAVAPARAQDAPFGRIMANAFDADEPGAAALVARGEEILFLDAVGMADLELGVSLAPDTRLARLVEASEMQVNSAHHQAVGEPAPGFTIDARAPDGVIEGIEDPSRRWFIGVQWHPEYEIDPGDKRIFDSFVAACAR